MNGFKVLAFLMGVALSVATASTSSAHAQRRSADLPLDAIEFLSRRATCLEWSKKTIDHRRTERINQSLQCDDIAKDEQALRERYAGNSDVLAALNARWTKIIQRVPVQTPVPSDLDR